MLQSGGKRTLQIFDILVSGPPRFRAELAKMIGTDVSKSTFRNALAPFNKLKFLEELADKRLQLADKCYPLGRDNDTAVAVSPDRQAESQSEGEAVDSSDDGSFDC
jgi:DNA-binding IclR family transcriptional regulator